MGSDSAGEVAWVRSNDGVCSVFDIDSNVKTLMLMFNPPWSLRKDLSNIFMVGNSMCLLNSQHQVPHKPRLTGTSEMNHSSLAFSHHSFKYTEVTWTCCTGHLKIAATLCPRTAVCGLHTQTSDADGWKRPWLSDQCWLHGLSYSVGMRA